MWLLDLYMVLNLAGHDNFVLLSVYWARPLITTLNEWRVIPLSLATIFRIRGFMYNVRLLTILFIILFMACIASAKHIVATANWPSWRGELANGTAVNSDPPITWGEDEHIRWKTSLPGMGHSTPVVWGDTIYLTSAMGFGKLHVPERINAPGAHGNLSQVQKQKLYVMAISLLTGDIVFETVVHEVVPHEGGYSSASFASQSPVTDGKYIYASFGSHGIFCLNLKGELQWQKDLGQMHTKHAHGEGSSLAICDSALFINWDHQGQSFLVALDTQTGDEKWKVLRNEKTSWASPTVIYHDHKPQLILSATHRIRSYNVNNGKVIWECGGLSDNVVASPVYGNGILVSGSSYNFKYMVAIDVAKAKGEITGTDAVLWRRKQQTPYVPSPLLYDNYVYFLRHYQGVMSQVDIKTGKTVGGPYRLKGIRDVYSSPIGAGNRIYVTDLNGTTAVLSHEKTCKILAMNKLNDSFSASAVAVGNVLLLRGEKSLYCITNDK